MASLLLLTLPSLAAAGEHELILGYSGFEYVSFARMSRIYQAAEIAYQRPAALEGKWSALRFGGGLRFGPPTPDTAAPIEGFVRAMLTAHLGLWEPSVGPELGVSGFSRLRKQGLQPAFDFYELENGLLGPLYIAFQVAPLRFSVGHFRVGLLELSIGTNAFPFGTATRLQVHFLRVGYTL